MASNALIISIVVAIIAIALGAAYQAGALDPIVEQVAKYFFKAKAKVEEKKLEAEGKKEGEDFLKSELKGNQQASEVAQGLGGIGALKKGF